MTITYAIVWSPFGGWIPVDTDGNILRLGTPYGQMPRRFKTGEACMRAVEKFYRKRK